MDTGKGIINNHFSGLEVHAINAASFVEHQPVDLRNLQRVVEEYNFTTVPITSQVLQPERKTALETKVIVYDKPEYVRNVDKHIEVLKSAKSLFSKRTLTLYHWMYPTIPKQQLKVNVAAAWENLPLTEKHFYISQVLGKFGYPQTSLMLNPQLQNLASASPDIFTKGIQTNTSTSVVQQQLRLFEPFNPNKILGQQQQGTRVVDSAKILRKTSTAMNGLDKRGLMLAGSQLINAGNCTRSLLIPQQQRFHQQHATDFPQYEQAEFVEVVKNKTDGQTGETAMYEIRLGSGANTRGINGRMPEVVTPGSRRIGDTRIVNDDSLNTFMANMLVPPSMAMFVQRATIPTKATIRNRVISKRRGRPPTLKRKPVKKNTEERYITFEVEDEFSNDPELRQELQQFESTLNMQI